MATPKFTGRYDRGDLVTLTATVVGTDGVTPAQPSYFAFLVKDANGSVTTYVFGASGASVINPGTGAFSKDVSLDPAVPDGKWYYRAIATGAVQAVEEWSFLVDRSFVL